MVTPNLSGTGWFDLSQGNFIIRQDYDSNGNSIYIGWAIPGSLSSDPNWRILNQTFDGLNRLTQTGFPSGSPSFTFIWDSRTTYSYK